MTNETLILSALESCEMSRLEIRHVTGIRTGALRPALLRLEERGEIVSSWDESLHPDHRVYRVASGPRPQPQPQPQPQPPESRAPSARGEPARPR